MTFFGLLLGFVFYMQLRNMWVFKVRERWVKEEDVRFYVQAASYDSMMLQFWKWSGDMRHWL